MDFGQKTCRISGANGRGLSLLHHISPLPLLLARGTTLPLEAVGGHVGALDELGVKLEAPATWAMVEGNGDEVETNVSYLPP